LFVFVVIGLVFSVLRQEIGWEERIRNDLLLLVGCKTLTQLINNYTVGHKKEPTYFCL